MKDILQTVLLTVIILSNISCVSSQYGNGDVVKEERDIDAFTKIETSYGWDLVLTQGDEYSLVVEAEENLLEDLITEVVNGTLKIYSKNRITRSRCKKIHLTFTELESIVASGGSDVYSESEISAERFIIELNGGSDLENMHFSGDQFIANLGGGSDAKIAFVNIADVNITASGGSDIQLKNISGKSCILNLSGGSDAILSGEVQNTEINASGGSDISAQKLMIKDCKLDLSGGSDAVMYVTNTLSYSLSGASDLICSGDPQLVHQDKCKSCDVIIR